MSGTGGGNGGGGGGGGEGPVNCANLILRVPLSSPEPAVLKKLKPKDELTLSLKAAGGPLLAITASGEVAGSVTSGKLVQLLKCIEEGWEYVAIVLRVDGGICEVEIRPEVGR